jgi:hypothetical protein
MIVSENLVTCNDFKHPELFSGMKLVYVHIIIINLIIDRANKLRTNRMHSLNTDGTGNMPTLKRNWIPIVAVVHALSDGADWKAPCHL